MRATSSELGAIFNAMGVWRALKVEMREAVATWWADPKKTMQTLDKWAREYALHNSAIYNGYYYKTLGGHAPEDECQIISEKNNMYAIPNGWSICDNSTDCLHQVANYSWGAYHLVLADGSSRGTKLISTITISDQVKWFDWIFPKCNPGQITNAKGGLRFAPAPVCNESVFSNAWCVAGINASESQSSTEIITACADGTRRASSSGNSQGCRT